MVYVHPQDDRYGPKVGGHRYKKWTPPEPLAITILKLAGLGVAFTAASILSPTFLLGAIKTYLNYKHNEAEYYDYLEKKRIQRSLRYLKRKKFIAFPRTGLSTVTKLGKQRLARVGIDQITVKRVPWDRFWRIVTFDIPEEKEGKREYLRRRLKEMGFYHFQRSVFVIPFPCKKEIEEMSKALGVETDVHVITANRFDGDEELKRYFQI